MNNLQKQSPKHYPKYKSQKAFTLIEMMVSVTIFLIVMTIVLGAVLSIIDGNKKTQAINGVSNNLSSSIESMVRDIKTGYKYRCGVPIGNPPASAPVVVVSGNLDVPAGTACNPTSAVNSITFMSTISGSPRPVQYFRSLSTSGKGSIVKVFCQANVADCTTPASYSRITVTSPDIDVTRFDLYVKVPTPSTDQPGVFVQIQGTAAVNLTQSSNFSIQTFISQRLLNI